MVTDIIMINFERKLLITNDLVKLRSKLKSIVKHAKNCIAGKRSNKNIKISLSK